MYLFKNDFDKRLIYQGNEMRVKNGIKDALSFTLQTSRNIYQPLLERVSNRNNVLINENQTLNQEKQVLINQNESILQRYSNRKRRDKETIQSLKQNINDIRKNGYDAYTKLTNDYIIESAIKPNNATPNDLIDFPKNSGQITFARTLKDVGTRLKELGIDMLPTGMAPSFRTDDLGRNTHIFGNLVERQNNYLNSINQKELAQKLKDKREYVVEKGNYLYKIKANKRDEDIKTFNKNSIFGDIVV